MVYIFIGTVLTILGLWGFRHFKKNFEFQYADITGISSSLIAMAIGISLIISAIT